jgi:hypothetical protein
VATKDTEDAKGSLRAPERASGLDLENSVATALF